jgi:hypothetical protein
MESSVLIDSTEIFNSGDKGISVGENSNVIVHNSHLNSNKIVELLKKVKIKKGEKNYFINLKKLYQVLIKNKIFLKDEIKYLEAWTEDCSKLI